MPFIRSGNSGGMTTAILYFVSDSSFEDYGVRCTPLVGSTSTTTTLDSSGEGYVQVQGADRYTIQLYHEESNVEVIDYTTYQNVETGGFYYIDIGLTTATWAGIKRIVDAGRAADFITNGDRFTVTLTTDEQLTFLANVNTYGLGEVDFIPAYCLSTTRSMNSSTSNVGGWNGCTMRSYLNQTFILTLPLDLQEVISEKENKLTQGSKSNVLVTSMDKIWLPAEFEIFGTRKYSGSAEDTVHVQYPIFTNQSSRVRTLGANGAATSWWESSPYINTSADFCLMTSSGTWASAGDAGAAYGVLPCFRIAPTVVSNS